MEFYHLINRGVDKRPIAQDDEDRVRFIHDLFVMNDRQSVLNFELPDRQHQTRRRKLLVRLHAFCLMGNHYHLLVSEVAPKGISIFMKKLNMGYAKYFNKKYERSGALWQGKFKKKRIERDAHFMYIPYYIHLNPLDFVMPEWREGKVRDTNEALKCLEKYRWSSHLDYLGEKNFPSLTERGLLSDMLGGRKKYEGEIAAILKDRSLASGSQALEP